MLFASGILLYLRGFLKFRTNTPNQLNYRLLGSVEQRYNTKTVTGKT